MRAVLLPAYGPPEVLRIGDWPEPRPRRGEVLVEVHAAGVNPVDAKIRSGGQRGLLRLRLPVVPGMDLSGVVLAVGPGVRGFSPGDEVFASPSHRVMGGYAERLALPAAQLARKPRGLSHVEAAGLPLAALTALACLDGLVHPGDRVLILAGSGGVGTLAIQLARHLGAQVATTCSARNRDLVLGLGANVVIDYNRQPFWEALEPVDLVLDALGGAARAGCWRVLRRGGHLRSIVSGLPENTRRWGPELGALVTLLGVARLKLEGLARGRPAASVLRPAHGPTLARIAALVEQGALRPVMDRVLPLEEVVEAHRHIETGRARGKVVLTLR